MPSPTKMWSRETVLTTKNEFACELICVVLMVQVMLLIEPPKYPMLDEAEVVANVEDTITIVVEDTDPAKRINAFPVALDTVVSVNVIIQFDITGNENVYCETSCVNVAELTVNTKPFTVGATNEMP